MLIRFKPLRKNASVLDRRTVARLLLAGLCTSIALPIAAPPAAARSTAGRQRAADAPPDIIVTGKPESAYPVIVDTLEDPNPQVTQYVRQAVTDATFFSRCVMPKDNTSLRDLVDGPPHSPTRAVALDRIVRNNLPCYPNYSPEPPRDPPYYGKCNPRGDYELKFTQTSTGGEVFVQPVFEFCQSDYDRGALVEKVLKTYAPDLKFTTADVFDPAVLARFRAREDRFDKDRSKRERIYAEVAACAIAVHPDLGLAYLATADRRSETQARAALIGTAPQCVGGATKVRIDPVQFRLFMADAMYSWAIALRGTDTLIPTAHVQGKAG